MNPVIGTGRVCVGGGAADSLKNQIYVNIEGNNAKNMFWGDRFKLFFPTPIIQ